MQMQSILQQASSCSVSINPVLPPQISNRVILCSPSMDDYAYKLFGDRKQSSYTAQLVCIHFRTWFGSCIACCPHTSPMTEPYALCLFQGQKKISQFLITCVREPQPLILKCCIILFFPMSSYNSSVLHNFQLFLKVCIYLNLIFNFQNCICFQIHICCYIVGVLHFPPKNFI